MTRVALVTGAGRGIGAATVRALAEAGWSVLATDSAADDPALPYPMATPGGLSRLAAEAGPAGQVHTFIADVRDPAAVRVLVEEGPTRVRELIRLGAEFDRHPDGTLMLTREGGHRADRGGELAGGYYVEPTIFEGNNSMRIFQEEIFGPVVSVTTFKDDDEALSLANDTLYGLGAGVWSRDANRCYRFGRAIQAGRVWVNCYHAYPAHAAFGGYKQSGIGRETHRMALEHYQQTKNMLVSYSPKKLGLF